MKQIIVMVAMVALGLALAIFIVGFGDSAGGLINELSQKMTYGNIIE